MPFCEINDNAFPENPTTHKIVKFFPMKIAFIISAMGLNMQGGLERVGGYLASKLAERQHKISIFARGDRPSDSSLHPAINFVRYTTPLSLHDVFLLKRSLLDLKPDICVPMFSWSELRYWALAAYNADIKLCISEHSDPWKIEQERWNRHERQACMAIADTIHLLQEPFKKSLPAKLHSRVHIIPNPVDVEAFGAAPAAGPVATARQSRSVIIASRLVETPKQISLAIEAFSLLPLSCGDWTLDIYGEGPDRPVYERMISELELQNRVFLHGHSDNMLKAYSTAQISAVPSKYEGFCLSMVEAMSQALPHVAFSDCSGIAHSAIDNITALLAPTMTARSFADTLARLMLDEDLRKRLGQRAQKHVKMFDPEKIISLWETMLHECIQQKKIHTKNGQLHVATSSLYNAIELSRIKIITELRKRMRIRK